MSEDAIQRGLEVFGELLGEDYRAKLDEGARQRGMMGDVSRLACEFAFAKIWDRPGLDRRQRSLVTIGILIAQRQSRELANHFRIAVNNGLTRRELEEAVLHSLPYVGFPANAVATTVLVEVLRDLGLDRDTETSEEIGLL